MKGRILSMLLVLTMLLSLVPAAVFAAGEAEGGRNLDVNGDGAVNSKDLTRLLKYLSGDSVTIF